MTAPGCLAWAQPGSLAAAKYVGLAVE
jgi:hypothetical protein